MVGKTAAMVLTIIGGAFYIVGGIVAGVIVGGALAFLGGLSGAPNPTETATSALLLGVEVGFATGIIIIIGGVLMHSKSRKVRVVGGVLAIIGMLFGIINTFGGLAIGFILTLLGSIFGFLYREPKPTVEQSPSQTSPS